MRSFLTGRGAAVRRRIQAEKDLYKDRKEETLVEEGKEREGGGTGGAVFRKFHPVPFTDLDKAVSSARAETETETELTNQDSCPEKAPCNTSSVHHSDSLL